MFERWSKPGSGDGNWDRLLNRQQGVFSRAQALSFVTEKALRGRVASGRWQRPHRGVFVMHNGPLTTQQRFWMASLAAGNGTPALLGGVSALMAEGFEHFTPAYIDILLPAGRRDHDPPCGVRIHRTSHLPSGDIDPYQHPPRTRGPRSVVDAAQWARTDHEARTIIAMSFQQRLVHGDQVHEVLDRIRVVKRRRLIERTAADARDGSQTVTELDLVGLCRAANLPVPSRQLVRTDRVGRKRYLDAYFDEWRIWVEIDGAHHMAPAHWWGDMQRHNALSIGGEVLLRFPAWVVRERPAEVVATIRAALIAAGWRP